MFRFYAASGKRQRYRDAVGALADTYPNDIFRFSLVASARVPNEF